MQLDEIWVGDRLSRRREALALERFLINEMNSFERIGFDHAYVLAIDSPYGVGKTWFLDRFSKHLKAKGHSIAKVDAWADDAGEEPMVAIMAAIEEAIKPDLSGSKARAILEGTISSFGQVFFEGSKAAGKKLAAKVVGKEGVETISDIFAVEVGDALESGTEASIEAIANVADKIARSAIDNYKVRKKSVATFKKQLSKLQSKIYERGESRLFVFIDELDRCRPSYAIKLLEEVKHLFDVSGIAFIFAIHAPQLETAIGAVYGNDFKSKDYLRRFFTTKYMLNDTTLNNVVSYYFETFDVNYSKMNRPITVPNHNSDYKQIEDVVARTLHSMDVGTRTAISILRALKIFADQWNEPVRFDVVFALYEIYRNLFDLNKIDDASIFSKKHRDFTVSGRTKDRSEFFSPDELVLEIKRHCEVSLYDIASNYMPNGQDAPLRRYVMDFLHEEAQARVFSSITAQTREYRTLFNSYAMRANVVGRYLTLELEELQREANG